MVMATPEPNPPTADSQGSSQFATTRWSIISAAADRDSPESRDALEALFTAYWYPLYVYIRRHGFSPEQAEDLTQEFFATLLEKDFFRGIDRSRGSFRSYLIACVRHFLANERDRAMAQKRGGGRAILSLDFPSAESQYRQAGSSGMTAESLYERQWALTLLGQVLDRLRDEWQSAGRGRLFDAVKHFLTGETGSQAYDAVAAELGMTAGAVRVAVHRLRRRYGELIREEIARTVRDPSEVDGEIRDLFRALG
jgi:RNA polymerase sigma-70 factor (ECF subfamily)